MVTPEQSALALTAQAAAQSQQRPPLSRIWHALESVPDPEVPAVSIVELGMVRGIEWDNGDPALLEALLANGVPAVRIEFELSPPWTTDWMSATAQRKLREYGIAPPGSGVPASALRGEARIDVSGISPLRRAAVVVPCPRCGSTRTQLVSQFGSTACKAQYRCTECLEPFDYFKPH